MENAAIQGIGDLRVVTEMFAQVQCAREDNCILVVTNADFGTSSNAGGIMTANATIAGTKNGGVVGGAVAGTVVGAVNYSAQQKVNDFYSCLDDRHRIAFDTSTYAGFLINALSDGIGIIPLKNSGQIIPKVKDLITDAEHFCFFRYDEIESMQIRSLPLRFSTKRLAICFKNTGEMKVYTPWNLPVKHKLVPYQEENYKKFAARF